MRYVKRNKKKNLKLNGATIFHWILSSKKTKQKRLLSCCKNYKTNKKKSMMGYCKSIYSCTTYVRQKKRKLITKTTLLAHGQKLGKNTVYIFLNSVMQHLPGEKKA